MKKNLLIHLITPTLLYIKHKPSSGCIRNRQICIPVFFSFNIVASLQ
jgi:hypothetical protein